jgi:energy-coupling factor transport system substrate-specific component
MKSTYKITVFEVVLVAVLSVVIGVAFWGWTFVYEIASPILKPVGMKYLFAGFWLFTGIFLPFIVRKPGVAVIASVISSLIEGFITRWGLSAVLWGFVQGLAAEIIFLIFGYKNWKISVLILASLFSAIASYALDFFNEAYYNLSIGFNLLQLGSFLLSSIIFAAILSYIVGKALAKTGVLNQFEIAKDFNSK